MKFNYATGGREKYFDKMGVRDCVTRAICNATGLDYLKIYNGINELAKKEHVTKNKRFKSSARNGVRPETAKKYIEEVLGWVWVPCMGIGTGCKVHLRASELPKTGAYILNLSGHFTCWKNGELYDIYDCSRGGKRCVYGYWRKPTYNEWYQHQIELAKATQARLEKENLKKQSKEVKAKNDKIKKAYAKKIHA